MRSPAPVGSSTCGRGSFGGYESIELRMVQPAGQSAIGSPNQLASDDDEGDQHHRGGDEQSPFVAPDPTGAWPSITAAVSSM